MCLGCTQRARVKEASTSVPRIVAEFKYFNVQRRPREKGRKTHAYWLISRSNSNRLGIIKWYASWRQFCFHPEMDTVWSDDCLACVREFLNDLKVDRAGYEEAPE
jgi:hypothetical protein